jgi:tetratricopeptide (TPR) repeat protein
MLGNTYLHLGMNAEADYWIDKSIEIDPHPINNFFRRNYRLKVHGRYEEMGRMLEQVIEEKLIDVSRVTVFAAEVISAIYMLTGDHESGIPLMERVIDPDKSLTNVGGGSVTMIDFMHMLVYSYRQVGRHEDAEALLEKCRQHLDFMRDEHDAASPGYLETRTLHHAMRGELETAVRTFEQAVDTGWRNYHFIKHDPRWQEFFALPAVQSQLAFVHADLERQRKLVEAMNSERDFRVIFEQKLADR